MNCPKCGARNLPTEVTCRKCGILLTVSTEELERVERFRQSQNRDLLSIIFVDISGFTGIANRSMPLSQKILTLHTVLVTTIVERDGAGEVVNTAGDGILAVFANPATAIERALEIQETVALYHQSAMPDDYRAEALREIDLPLAPLPGDEAYQVHIGANLGLVTRGGRTSHDVFGHNVNVTCRLCSLAGKGQIYMTDAVYDNARLILGERGDLNWQTWKDVPIAGLNAPMNIVALAQQPYHEITQPRTRYHPARRLRLPRYAPALAIALVGVALLAVVALPNVRAWRLPARAPAAASPQGQATTVPTAAPGTSDAPAPDADNPPNGAPDTPGTPALSAPAPSPVEAKIAAFKTATILDGKSIAFRYEATIIPATLLMTSDQHGALIVIGINRAVGEAAEMAIWIDGDNNGTLQSQPAPACTDFLLRCDGPAATHPREPSWMAVANGEASQTLPMEDGVLARARYSDDWSLWFFHFPYAVLPSPTPKTIHLGAQYWPEGQGKAQFTFPAKGEFQEMLLQP